MKLESYIKLGAIHNPYYWIPGFVYCLFCKQYQLPVSFTLSDYDTRTFCRTCHNDFDDQPNEVN